MKSQEAGYRPLSYPTSTAINEAPWVGWEPEGLNKWKGKVGVKHSLPVRVLQLNCFKLVLYDAYNTN